LSRRYNQALGPPKFFRLHQLGFLPPKIAGSRSNLRAASVSTCLWRARPRNNTSEWFRKDWANWTNQASPSWRSKIDMNTPAIAS